MAQSFTPGRAGLLDRIDLFGSAFWLNGRAPTLSVNFYSGDLLVGKGPNARRLVGTKRISLADLPLNGVIPLNVADLRIRTEEGVPLTFEMQLPRCRAAPCVHGITSWTTFLNGSRTAGYAGGGLYLNGSLPDPTTYLSVQNDLNFRTWVETGKGNPGPAVPEPESWLLMIAGFGILGGTVRLRTVVRRRDRRPTSPALTH